MVACAFLFFKSKYCTHKYYSTDVYTSIVQFHETKFVDARCPYSQSVTSVMLTTAETVAATSAGLNRHFSSAAT